jgi:hypothetical protein
MLDLAILADCLPDEESPLLRDQMTDRLVQLMEHLQPLSSWQGHGIQNVHLARELVSCREIEALGAALGASCRRLHVLGISGEEAKQEARLGIPLWFPHVGTNYTLS